MFNDTFSPRLPLRWWALAVLALGLSSCSGPLVNLSPLAVQTWPQTDDQVLVAADTIRITFSDPLDHPSAQSLLRVASAEGTVSGDLSWSGNTLVLNPVPALIPGRRYNLEFNGQVTLVDGRKFRVEKEIPFYSGNAGAPAHLVSYCPSDGASAAVHTPLVLSFDVAIDPATFQAGFSLSPPTSTTRSWSSDGLTVTIVPTSAWAAATLYRWQLAVTVKTPQGPPLVAAVDRSFLTNADQTPPQIVSLLPALWAPPRWTVAGSDLDDLAKGDAILITATKALDLATVDTAFHLVPSVKGHVVAQSGSTAPYEYVYVFDEEFSPGTSYALQITTDLTDTVGNALTTPVPATFTPAIPYLQITGITLTGTATTAFLAANSDLNKVNCFPVCRPSGVSGSLQVVVTVEFTPSFTVAEKNQFAVLSFCQPLFPTTGASAPTPTLVTVAFDSSTAATSATLTYQGFSVNATAGAPYYYQIRIPGGLSGLKTSRGNTLKEDVWLNFATGS